MNINEQILKFLKNEITYEEIINVITNEDLTWLNEKYLSLKDNNEVETLDFSYESINDYISFIEQVEDVFYKKSELYELLYYCMSLSYNIEKNNVYLKKYGLVLKYVPDYICGSSTSAILEKIVDEIYHNSKINKKEYINKKCIEIFFLDKKNKPRWVQEPEWPVLEGVPLIFVKQIRKHDKVEYYFINKNGDSIIVEQYY